MRENLESGIGYAVHYLKHPALGLQQPVAKGGAMNSVSPVRHDFHQTRKCAREHGAESQKRALIVMNPGAVDYGNQNQPQRVHDYMALDAAHLLAAVKAANTGDSGAFDALRVDYAETWVWVASLLNANPFPQGGIELAQRLVAAPLPEPFVDKMPVGKLESTELSDCNQSPFCKPFR